jgi:hypothetical protein
VEAVVNQRARLAAFTRLAPLALCVATGCFGHLAGGDQAPAAHPPAETRSEAMPELVELAAIDLECPRDSVSWDCPDACIEDAWPGDSTTIVRGCGRVATYRFKGGHWINYGIDDDN